MADDERKRIEDEKKRKQAETDRKRAEVRARLEEASKAKKAKKGFMTPDRKKKLRLLLRKKAAEELKKEQERKAAERRRIIEERCGKPKNADDANEAELQTICSAYWHRLYALEGDKFDLERKIKLKEFEISDLNSQVNDLRGKFMKPTLKKVSKYENKFAKLQKKAAEFNFRNQLKQVKKKEFTLEEEDKEKKPDWSKKGDEKKEGEQPAEGAPAEGAPAEGAPAEAKPEEATAPTPEPPPAEAPPVEAVPVEVPPEEPPKPVYGPNERAQVQKRIELIQNACLRFAYGIRQYDPISHAFEQSDRRNMRKKWLLHLCCLIYKILANGAQPPQPQGGEGAPEASPADPAAEGAPPAEGEAPPAEAPPAEGEVPPPSESPLPPAGPPVVEASA